MQRDMPNMATLLQLIKQHDYKFDKDEVLEIYTRGFGRWGGFFFTPNKTSELIAVIGQIYNPKTVIDICCGSGNILSYFKNMKTVKGIDINTDSIQLAQYINPNADFSVADVLEYNFGDAKYDLVVGHAPFGLMVANRRNMEIEIIKKGLETLNKNGAAIFIVSENLLASNNRELSEFRHELLSNFSLDMIISLPIGIFSPYTSIKSSIIVVRNGKKNKDIFMPNFEDNYVEIADNFKQHKGDFYLPISKITDRLDRNHYASLEIIEEIISGHKLIKLSDVSDIIGGKYLDRNAIATNGKYSVFTKKDKNGNNFIDNVPDERCVLMPNDIVVSLWDHKPNNAVFIYKDTNIKIVIPQLYAIIRPKKYHEYLATYLQTQDWKIILQRHLKNTIQPKLTVQDLKNIEIPLLSDLELNELVSKTLRIDNKTRYYVLESLEYLDKKEYEEAEYSIEQAFENIDSDELHYKDVCLKNIQNKALLKKDSLNKI